MIFALALLLSTFDMPVFHLVWIQDGKAVESVEDMTLSECKERAKHYKLRAQAQCYLSIVTREYI